MFHTKNCSATVNLIALVRCFFFIAERNFVLGNIITAMFISECILTAVLFATILRRVNTHSGQGPAADSRGGSGGRGGGGMGGPCPPSGLSKR